MKSQNNIPTVSNDDELRSVFKQFDEVENRIVGAMLVEDVLLLTTDERVKRAVITALDKNTSNDELSDVSKSLKSAVFNSSTRCGADGDWNEQASHFVTRAANAVVTPKLQRDSVDPLWQIVQSCRMARNCSLIASNDDSDNPEAENQYKIVNKFLKNNPSSVA